MQERHYQAGSTIVAIATPAGEGAISIVRISGPNALEIGSRIFDGPIKTYKGHTAHVGNILDERGAILDYALALVFRSPRSYTGEDTVEFHCHGGSLVTKKVLQRALQAGALPALPGEFTFQAFMNKKLDLAQAEAVQQLIGSKNDLATAAAGSHLAGALSNTIRRFQEELTGIAAILEAWVDFPEEGLEFMSFEEMIRSLEDIEIRMQKLAATFEDGKTIHEGLSLCLLGTPNVGKSSLMNALLGKERAIVTEIAGTTRDLLEEDLRIGSLHFRLIDTAGIRDTREVIEQEGIRRSKEAMQRSDVILLVLDAGRPLSNEDRSLIEAAPQDKTILVWNKVDLGHPSQPIEWPISVCLSAKHRSGLEELKNAIDALIWRHGPPSKEEVLLSSLRQKQALSNAIFSCRAVIDGLKSETSAEFAASDMRDCLAHLSSIIGTNVSEDILNALFSRFCLGK